ALTKETLFTKAKAQSRRFKRATAFNKKLDKRRNNELFNLPHYYPVQKQRPGLRRRHTIANCATGVDLGIPGSGVTDESDHRSVGAESLPGRTRQGHTSFSYRLR